MCIEVIAWNVIVVFLRHSVLYRVCEQCEFDSTHLAEIDFGAFLGQDSRPSVRAPLIAMLAAQLSELVDPHSLRARYHAPSGVFELWACDRRTDGRTESSNA